MRHCTEEPYRPLHPQFEPDLAMGIPGDRVPELESWGSAVGERETSR
jgi:hypothetical protein